jgi:hypothetical protein
MELNFNVSGEKRKALVKAVGEILGAKPKYLGAPSFEFAVGDFVIDRGGKLFFSEDSNDAATELLPKLSELGFAPEEVTAEIPAETLAPDEAPEVLTIEIPLEGFSEAALLNLEKLVAAKAWIFKKMSGTEELAIKRLDDRLRFPWFRASSTPQEVSAYTQLIAQLCETAKAKKNVNAKERTLEDGDNEKFKARCTLLSLGFIGPEFAQARKILLAPMSGSGGFKQGNRKKEVTVPLHLADAETAETDTEEDNSDGC